MVRSARLTGCAITLNCKPAIVVTAAEMNARAAIDRRCGERHDERGHSQQAGRAAPVERALPGAPSPAATPTATITGHEMPSAAPDASSSDGAPSRVARTWAIRPPPIQPAIAPAPTRPHVCLACRRFSTCPVSTEACGATIPGLHPDPHVDRPHHPLGAERRQADPQRSIAGREAEGRDNQDSPDRQTDAQPQLQPYHHHDAGHRREVDSGHLQRREAVEKNGVAHRLADDGTGDCQE